MWGHLKERKGKKNYNYIIISKINKKIPRPPPLRGVALGYNEQIHDGEVEKTEKRKGAHTVKRGRTGNTMAVTGERAG